MSGDDAKDFDADDFAAFLADLPESVPDTESHDDVVVDDDLGPDPETTASEVAPGGPLCEVCQAPIEWSGRGRKPKKCADHKTRTSTSASGGKTRGRRSAARLEELESDLLREFVGFGKNASAILPTFGITVVARSEKTAKALTRIAADHPKVLEVLEIATRVVPLLDLGEAFLSIAVALMVDLGRINPDSMIARNSGVSEIWHEVHDEDGPGTATFIVGRDEPSSAPGFPTVEVPPRFVRAGR